jgi:hypothetical protein
MYFSSSVSCEVSRRDNFTMKPRYLKSSIVEFRFSIWKSFVVGDWGCLIISKGDEGARFQWGGCELNDTVDEITNDYQSNLYHVTHSSSIKGQVRHKSLHVTSVCAFAYFIKLVRVNLKYAKAQTDVTSWQAFPRTWPLREIAASYPGSCAPSLPRAENAINY